jgi:hypothetical protein
MSRLGKKYDWFPVSLLNDNHDYKVYSQFYKENLINYDSIIQRFGDVIDRMELFFAIPVLYNKTFTDKMFDMYQWIEFKEKVKESGYETTLNDDT